MWELVNGNYKATPLSNLDIVDQPKWLKNAIGNYLKIINLLYELDPTLSYFNCATKYNFYDFLFVAIKNQEIVSYN